MRVMVAMSGGVDSSVAAALLCQQGHDVVGVTMRLWGGPSDTGCCAVSDVDDARRVAHQLDIEHHVFNFGEEFERDVVAPYAAAWSSGKTPNPCIECNRHIKFDVLTRRAALLGFDCVATGHHARIVTVDGRPRLARGADAAKDQSYVLAPIIARDLERILLPIGHLAKSEVRSIAESLGLRTAGKRDSQDVCFISSDSGRASFLGDRIALTPGRVLDGSGEEVGRVAAVELITIGQRKGLGLAGGAHPRYVVDVDPLAATVSVGSHEDLLRSETAIAEVEWARRTTGSVRVEAQVSAHGRSRSATLEIGADQTAAVRYDEAHPRVAPGQTVVCYEPGGVGIQGDLVLAAGIAV